MSWILASPRIADRSGGSDFLDLAELRAWAGRHNFLMLVEALPEAASGPRIQRTMLPAYIQNHVSKTIGDDLAESLITAEPEKYANSDPRMCEAAPVWVYAMELAGRIDTSIQTAIDQGEIIPFDAAGMPVERRPRPPEAQPLALDEQRPETAPAPATESTRAADANVEPWIQRAREYAKDIWLRMLDCNKRPSKEGIAPEIAARLHRDDKMVTKRGARITDEYILRHALSPTKNGGWQPPVSD